MTRKSILDGAMQCVTTDRERQYGAPEDNFKLIGHLWGDYLRASMETIIRDPSPDEVAIMLALLKVARIATGQAKEDNYIDLAGYAACAGEIAGKRAEEEPQPTVKTYRDVVAERWPSKINGSPDDGFVDRCPGDYFDGAADTPPTCSLDCRVCWSQPYQGEEIIYRGGAD